MKSLSPSGVELEIMTLANFDMGEETPDQKITLFLSMLLSAIRKRHDTDYIHALLNCCLKSHYDLIVTTESLVDKLREIRQASQESFAKMDELLNHNICMISNFTGVQITSNSFNL